MDTNTMTAEETLAACGGEVKCGGSDVPFRCTISGVGVVWRDRVGPGKPVPPLSARTIDGKFRRGGQAEAMMRGD